MGAGRRAARHDGAGESAVKGHDVHPSESPLAAEGVRGREREGLHAGRAWGGARPRASLRGKAGDWEKIRVGGLRRVRRTAGGG